MSIVNKIEVWISDKNSFYFFLPNGPYGRPLDNQYVIEHIKPLDDGLEIYFSDEIVMKFLGDTDLSIEHDKIILSNFSEFAFYVNGKTLKIYLSGEVTINGFRYNFVIAFKD